MDAAARLQGDVGAHHCVIPAEHASTDGRLAAGHYLAAGGDGVLTHREV